MDWNQAYVVHSLENHLFFDRIMKEHSFFLKVGFLPPNANLAGEGEHFLREFEHLLSRAISLSALVVSQAVLDSGELATEFTQRAERQTQHFTGSCLDRNLTRRVMELEGREEGKMVCIPQELTAQVRRLNQDGLGLLDGLIQFKQSLLNSVNGCKLFTVNYPLLIEHILREAKLFRSHLRRLEGLDSRSGGEIMNEELFWDQIMMEHALFIRGLLDPSEENLVCTANDFAGEYKRLLEECDRANGKINEAALPLTRRFRDFKVAGVTGIEDCKIRSIILPLLADHVLREANHFLRLLGERC